MKSDKHVNYAQHFDLTPSFVLLMDGLWALDHGQADVLTFENLIIRKHCNAFQTHLLFRTGVQKLHALSFRAKSQKMQCCLFMYRVLN